MADTGKPDDDGPSLEMPSFSLRRKKTAPPEDVAPEPEDVAPEPEPEPEPTVEVPTQPAPPAYEPPTAVVPVVEDAHEDDEPAPAEPRAPREAPLSGLPAAAATGLVVGGLAVLCSWLAASGCEAVRGTSSCGGGPGFLILLAVLVLLALAGSWLLALFGVPEAGSTSLLAVGILAVLVMLFLLGSLDEGWAALAVPVTAVLAYSLSWWVTHAVVGEDTQQGAAEPRDVR